MTTRADLRWMTAAAFPLARRRERERAGPAMVLALSLLVGSCGRDGPNGLPTDPPPGPETPPTPHQLVIVSGDGQRGRAGRALAEPLVVRVVDSLGGAVEGVAVQWTVTAGEARLDGHWGSCEQGRMITRNSSLTDVDGTARVAVVATWIGPVSVAAEAAGRTPVTFRLDASDSGTTVTSVSGGGQQGALSPLYEAEPFVVRVTDSEGNAVPYVPVHWTTRAGAGRLTPALSHRPGCADSGLTTHTQADGTTALRYQPAAYGQNVVRADVVGVPSAVAEFELDVTLIEIGLDYDPWEMSTGIFSGPNYSSDVLVPIGANVQFRNLLPSARIVSTSTPSGGPSFDSGPLGAGQLFRFVPAMGGRWTFSDQVSQATGTLSTALTFAIGYDEFWDYHYVTPWSADIARGIALEFWNQSDSAQIVATKVPPGGTAFDSGMLRKDERVMVVPNAAGLWEFTDRVNGASASVMIR